MIDSGFKISLKKDLPFIQPTSLLLFYLNAFYYCSRLRCWLDCNPLLNVPLRIMGAVVFLNRVKELAYFFNMDSVLMEYNRGIKFVTDPGSVYSNIHTRPA